MGQRNPSNKAMSFAVLMKYKGAATQMHPEPMTYGAASTTARNHAITKPQSILARLLQLEQWFGVTTGGQKRPLLNVSLSH